MIQRRLNLADARQLRLEFVNELGYLRGHPGDLVRVVSPGWACWPHWPDWSRCSDLAPVSDWSSRARDSSRSSLAA